MPSALLQRASIQSMFISFRDPAGNLLSVNGRIIRVINESGIQDTRAFLSSYAAQKFVDAGRLVRTDLLDSSVDVLPPNRSVLKSFDCNDALLVEHERIPFQSYPYEWPPEMLHAAGLLTLDIAETLLAEGLGLKDATPYNVLFRGPNPVFVDICSFERRDPCDPTWLPYAQFVRTILLPLLVNKRFGLQLDQLLTTRRDGLEPEEVYKLCGSVQKLLPPFVSMVSVPTWLASAGGTKERQIYSKQRMANREKAQFVLRQLFKGLRRKLKKVAPEAGKISTWSNYTDHNDYTRDYLPVKREFVDSVIKERKPKRVLDVGCNTGHFSEIAALGGASVIAIDYDPVVIGQLWQEAYRQKLDILPLVVNLTRPTPNTGWRNQECLSFLDRSRGAFDVVLMLAVVHHMLVSERIPLSQILELAAEITKDTLVIEYVSPEDPMFRRLTRGRDHLHKNLTLETFETACRQFFDVVRFQRVDESNRWLFFLRKKGTNGSA